jgi:hypothetical protein
MPWKGCSVMDAMPGSNLLIQYNDDAAGVTPAQLFTFTAQYTAQ